MGAIRNSLVTGLALAIAAPLAAETVAIRAGSGLVVRDEAAMAATVS